MQRMDEGWAERLREVIADDPRSLLKISEAAGLGRNYVQQMMKRGTAPNADKLADLLEVLGRDAALYVLTGLRIDQQDLELLKTWKRVPPGARQGALQLFRSFQADPGSEEPPPAEKAS